MSNRRDHRHERETGPPPAAKAASQGDQSGIARHAQPATGMRRDSVCISLIFVLAAAGIVLFLSSPADQDSGVTGWLDRQPIVAIQSHLRIIGYEVGPVDGIWGPRSSAAQKQYLTEIGDPLIDEPSAAVMIVDQIAP